MLPRPAIGESDFLNIRRQGALWSGAPPAAGDPGR